MGKFRRILCYKNPDKRIVELGEEQPNIESVQLYCHHCCKWIPRASWSWHKKNECIFQPNTGVFKYKQKGLKMLPGNKEWQLDWHKWFAWHPVVIVVNGKSKITWLHFVERRRMIGNPHRWIYHRR